MTRPLVFLDCETTGLNPEVDRIIELALIHDEHAITSQWRFNPGIPVSPEAQAVHGITNTMLRGEPSFGERALHISKLLTGVDLAGYSLRLLDLPILAAEFERYGVQWEFDGLIIDVAGIYHKKFPRDLAAAVHHYLGRSHAGAHGALADCEATRLVFWSQIAVHDDLAGMVPAELARFSQYGDLELVDLAGKLARDKDGDMVYTFGKHRGRKVKDEPGFGHWMLRSNFPANTLKRLMEEFDRINGVTAEERQENDESIPF